MEPLYKRFVNEVIDEKGMLKDITFNIPSDFNYGFDVVDEIARRTPDKKAMVWLSKDKEERIFTFSDISRYSNKVANYFRSLGIGRGDKVMLVLKRHYEFWFCSIALNKLGAVVIPATHQLMKKDFVYRFNAANVKGIVCTPMDGVCDEVDEACKEYDGLIFKAVVKTDREGWENFDAGMEACSDVFDRPEGLTADMDMLMYFTSGTTGYPKIATHTHKYAIGHIVTAVWWHNVTPDGLHFAISDTGWGKAAWGKLYGQWLAETCLFTFDFDRFHAEDILPLFAQYKITTFCAPPTMYRFFIKEDLTKYDLSSLKYCNIAGEALNPEVFRQWYNQTGLKMMEGFGQTETTLVVANLRGMEPKPGSMGKPNPQYDVEIVDNDDKPVAVGETGEIVIRVDRREPVGLFSRYYGSEEQTNEALHDGLYHTGDTAYKDEDGYYWYVGRKDDVIKSSGYRIGPFEIESVIMEHPKVLEVAVTGVPDPVRGFVVKATIVLVKGEKGSPELAKEIQEFVKHHTAPYKYPRVVQFVDELPKTISGKIQRAKIRLSDAK